MLVEVVRVLSWLPHDPLIPDPAPLAPPGMGWVGTVISVMKWGLLVAAVFGFGLAGLSTSKFGQAHADNGLMAMGAKYAQVVVGTGVGLAAVSIVLWIFT